MKKLPVFFLFLLIGAVSFGQDLLMDLEYGVGNQHFNRLSDDEVTPDYLTQHAGLLFEFSPYFSMLYIKTGAEYAFSDLGSEIRFPLSFRIAADKKFSPFAELGACYNVVLQDTEDDYLQRSDFNLFGRAGLTLRIKEKFYLELSYRYVYGLTTRLEEEVLLPLDQKLTEEYRGILQGLSLSFKYRLF